MLFKTIDNIWSKPNSKSKPKLNQTELYYAFSSFYSKIKKTLTEPD